MLEAPIVFIKASFLNPQLCKPQIQPAGERYGTAITTLDTATSFTNSSNFHPPSVRLSVVRCRAMKTTQQLSQRSSSPS